MSHCWSKINQLFTSTSVIYLNLTLNQTTSTDLTWHTASGCETTWINDKHERLCQHSAKVPLLWHCVFWTLNQPSNDRSRYNVHSLSSDKNNLYWAPVGRISLSGIKVHCRWLSDVLTPGGNGWYEDEIKAFMLCFLTSLFFFASQVSPASGLVSILKKRSVCLDSVSVSASSEAGPVKTPAKRRVRFRVPDDGYEQG